MTKDRTGDVLLDIHAVAEALHTTRNGIYQMRKDKTQLAFMFKLPGGRKLVCWRTDLLDWVEQQRVLAAAAELECEGHESLDGAHMGESVFCDGACVVAR